MSTASSAAGFTLGFGVGPGIVRDHLRWARYHALAETVAQYVRYRSDPRGRRMKLLDVGVGSGTSLRYLETQADVARIELHGVDRFPHGSGCVYKQHLWRMHDLDLEEGMPSLPSDTFDVVVCEHVLDHLREAPRVAFELSRVLRPGGLAILGVPICWSGLQLVRKHVAPVLDRLAGRQPRRHVQAYSLPSFLRMLRKCTEFDVFGNRGFRLAAGGVFRSFGHRRWWWQLNRYLGELLPSLCSEVHVLATKRQSSGFAETTGERRSSEVAVHA